MSIEVVIETKIEQMRKRFLKYTRQAFQSLPKNDKPHILDFGCGSGNPTIELAKLSGGKIVGVDIDQNELEKLDKKILEKGLTKRIITKKCSKKDLDFPEESFDIIWAEGSIHIIGFEKGFKELGPLLRNKGFLVVHDGVNDVSSNLKKIHDLGYRLINQFRLPDNEWQINYFEPLEMLIQQLQKKSKNTVNNTILEKYQKQVKAFKKNPKENISAFYIFQKTNSSIGK